MPHVKPTREREIEFSYSEKGPHVTVYFDVEEDDTPGDYYAVFDATDIEVRDDNDCPLPVTQEIIDRAAIEANDDILDNYGDSLAMRDADLYD